MSDAANISLKKGSYGPPYTLTLNVSAPFTLAGPDTTLSLASLQSNSSNTPSTALSLLFTTSDNFPYPLRAVSPLDGHDPGHPGRIWTNQSSSTHFPLSITLPATLRLETDVVNGTRVWVNGDFAGRFEAFVYGGRNTLFSWSQMALVAPLDQLEGGVDSVVLEPGVGKGAIEGGYGNDSVVVLGTSGSFQRREGRGWWFGVVVGVIQVALMCG
jgi:hexosaminidase